MRNPYATHPTPAPRPATPRPVSTLPSVADADAPVDRLPAVERVALDTAEACAALGVADGTLREMIAAGIVPAVRVGRRILVPVDALRRRLADLALAEADARAADAGGRGAA